MNRACGCERFDSILSSQVRPRSRLPNDSLTLVGWDAGKQQSVRLEKVH